MNQLHNIWEEVLSSYPQGLAKLRKVLKIYETPSRHYHNLKHLSEMTRIFQEYRSTLVNFSDLIFACLWHDIVYDTQNKDNEEQSYNMWISDSAEMRIPVKQQEKVGNFILATKKHTLNNEDSDMAIFLDADLAILGSDENRYGEYMRDIRKEYSHIPDAEFGTGRAALLKKFLERPNIYFNSEIGERFEKKARQNLQSEIAILMGD